MNLCDKSPTGHCCYHYENAGLAFYSVRAPEQICCHCGKTESSRHGPHHPNRAQNAQFATTTLAGSPIGIAGKLTGATFDGE